MAIRGRGERDPPELLRPLEVGYVRTLSGVVEALTEAGDDIIAPLLDRPGVTRRQVRAAIAAAVRRARREVSARATAEAAAAQWDRITALSERVSARRIRPLLDDAHADEDAERLARAASRAKTRISGRLLRRYQVEQAKLVTSLSVEWAGRLANELESAVGRGSAPDVLAKILERTNEIAENRAVAIGENETQRWFAAQQQVRYSEAGLDEYVWMSQRDSRVRPLHREYDGRTFRWSDTVQDAPPGSAYGCRCWAEPLVRRSAT